MIMVGSVQSGVRDSCDEVNKILLISSKKEDCELVIGLPFALLALFFSLMQKTKQYHHELYLGSPSSAFFATERYMGFPQYEYQSGNPIVPSQQPENYDLHTPSYLSTGDSFYFDTPEQEDPNSQSKLALQSDAKSHFCSNKNYGSDERSYKTPCNNFSETEHIFLLKRKLLGDFDNSDMRHPSIPFERNRDLSHEHLRQSAARPAGGVSVTSGNTGSAISSKTRIRWTQDLHDHFVECVNHLGGAEKKYRIAKYMPDSAEGKSERKNNMNDAAQIDIKASVLANMKRVSDLNNLNSKVMGLTWGMWDATIFSIHQKVILGADVLYDTSGFDDLLATVTFLLQNSPGSVFITTYHSRSGHHLIEFLMAKWVLKCTKLLDGFLCMPSYKASGMAEIVLNSEEVR
ncbi:unnamed protein product [Camellia sinensis]